MAIADERLKQFFLKQKVGAFDALKQSAETAAPKNDFSSKTQEKESALATPQKIVQTLANPEIKQQNQDNSAPPLAVDNSTTSKYSSRGAVLENTPEPLAIREQSVINPRSNR